MRAANTDHGLADQIPATPASSPGEPASGIALPRGARRRAAARATATNEAVEIPRGARARRTRKPAALADPAKSQPRPTEPEEPDSQPVPAAAPDPAPQTVSEPLQDPLEDTWLLDDAWLQRTAPRIQEATAPSTADAPRPRAAITPKPTKAAKKPKAPKAEKKPKPKAPKPTKAPSGAAESTAGRLTHGRRRRTVLITCGVAVPLAVVAIAAAGTVAPTAAPSTFLRPTVSAFGLTTQLQRVQERVVLEQRKQQRAERRAAARRTAANRQRAAAAKARQRRIAAARSRATEPAHAAPVRRAAPATAAAAAPAAAAPRPSRTQSQPSGCVPNALGPC